MRSVIFMKDNKKGNLYICTTYYHLYITLLKLFQNKSRNSVVICDDIPNAIQLVYRLKDEKIFEDVFYVKQSDLPLLRGKNPIDWFFFQHERRAREIRKVLPFSIQSFKDIYIYHDATNIGKYLTDEKVNYHLIEDSLDFYQHILDGVHKKDRYDFGIQRWVRQYLGVGYLPLGNSSYVIDIEVNKNQNLQLARKKKIIELPRTNLEATLRKKEIDLLLKLFRCPKIEIPDKKTALILTQPFFKDGFYKMKNQQIDLYQEMFQFLLDKDCEVWLKPHPRDDEDYSFLSLTVVNKDFPIELLQFSFDYIFDYVLTVSSASFVKAKEVIYWKLDSE